MTATSPVLKQIAGLPKLSHAELKALWKEYFGEGAAGLPPRLSDPRPRASPPGADLRRR